MGFEAGPCDWYTQKRNLYTTRPHCHAFFAPGLSGKHRGKWWARGPGPGFWVGQSQCTPLNCCFTCPSLPMCSRIILTPSEGLTCAQISGLGQFIERRYVGRRFIESARPAVHQNFRALNFGHQICVLKLQTYIYIE